MIKTLRPAPAGITCHRLLDPGECDLAWQQLLLNQSRWIERPIPGAPDGAVFHTMGRASYIDAGASPDPGRDYFAAIARSNQVLRRHFGWLLDLVRGRLAEVLDAPIAFLDGAALPGFHIFDSAALIGGKTARIHFDLQYLALRLPEAPDAGEMLSFTLPIVLPECGGGLDVWNVTHEEYLRGPRGQTGRGPEEFVKGRRSRRVRYQVGTLVLQTRHLLHRIANVNPVKSTDLRVTLQGHGLRFGGEWRLYW